MAAKIKTVEIQIAGVSPLLVHRFNEESEQGKSTRRVIQDHGTPREQAEKVVYKNADGFFFPGTWIMGAWVEAGGNHKLRGSRKSAKYIVPAAIRVIELHIPILNGDGKSRVPDFEVDSRPVTIPATKGKVMRHRPRYDCWSAKFTAKINENLLPEDFSQQLLTEAGEQQGIGDFRPNKRGPFGTFRVTSWQEIS